MSPLHVCAKGVLACWWNTAICASVLRVGWHGCVDAGGQASVLLVPELLRGCVLRGGAAAFAKGLCGSGYEAGQRCRRHAAP